MYSNIYCNRSHNKNLVLNWVQNYCLFIKSYRAVSSFYLCSFGRIFYWYIGNYMACDAYQNDNKNTWLVNRFIYRYRHSHRYNYNINVKHKRTDRPYAFYNVSIRSSKLSDYITTLATKTFYIYAINGIRFKFLYHFISSWNHCWELLSAQFCRTWLFPFCCLLLYL